MTKEKSQRITILNHLQKYGSITPLQALDYYRIYRLSSIIQRLRKEHVIATEKPISGEYAVYRYERPLSEVKV